MKELYTSPEIKVETLDKPDVLCASAPYNIQGSFSTMVSFFSNPDLFGDL